MNLLTNTLHQGVNSLRSWTQTTSVPDAIDYVTYNQYETSNPLRLKFYDENSIHNNAIKQTANIAQNIGAEVVSAYVNPFYLTHKIVNIPTNYHNVVNTYKNSQYYIQHHNA